MRPEISLSLISLVFLVAISCASSSSLVGKGTESKKFKSLIPESAVFDDGITGFALYDPQNEEWLYQYQADKLFTPASNAKILTLYSALKYLGDSIAFAKIQQSSDTLTLYPMGDPTFLNPVFPQNSQLINRLSKQKGPFVISNSHFTGNRFGRGWAWDDFAFGFQPEISMFPVYGNLVHLHLSETGLLSVEPPYFSSFTLITKEPEKYGSNVSRDEFSNSFEFSVGKGKIEETTFRIPFNTYPYLMKELLEDTFDFEVSNIYPDSKFIEGDQQWNSIRLDTVLRRLMYHSDNFIAEQLLLQISAVELGYMNTDSIIGKLRYEIKAIIPDSIQWVDGSGLSRYNQMSPRSLVRVLEKLAAEHTLEVMQSFFPAGGLQGTIIDLYGDGEEPFLHAKTGTMKGVHCLSGYITTDSGRELIFSFMHNQFFGSNVRYKEEMEEILRYIKVKY